MHFKIKYETILSKGSRISVILSNAFQDLGFGDRKRFEELLLDIDCELDTLCRCPSRSVDGAQVTESAIRGLCQTERVKTASEEAKARIRIGTFHLRFSLG